MPFWSGIAKFGMGGFRLFKGFFRFGILTFFMTIIIIGAVYTGIQAGDPVVILEELGNQFLKPIENLGEASKEIIQKEGFISQEAEGIFQKTWSFLSSTWVFLSPLYIILLWMRVLAMLFTNMVMWDKAKKPVGWVLAFIFFFLLSALYLAETGQGGLDTIMTSLKHFKEALVTLIEPLSRLGKGYIGT